MGGAGFVFTGENDADIIHNSVSINLNVLEEQRKFNETVGNKTKIFYSDQDMYPEHNQLDPDNPDCREESDTPDPDSEYGWEKLFSGGCIFIIGIYIPVRLPYHNIFGPEGTWEGGREKSLLKQLP